MIKNQHLHFDCVSGIAGDMTLGAFLDLGVPLQVIEEAIVATGLGSGRVQVETVLKSGIAATNLSVCCEGFPEASDEHNHYHYSDIRRRIESSTLNSKTISLSLKIFDKVAEAEAKMHGLEVSAVAFHEVGAVDSIVDIVGVAAALVWLAPISVSCSVVAMGRGSIRCAHGLLPVPSPAALEIMKRAGAPICDGGVEKELCTPTGAAIVATIVEQWGAMPTITPIEIGYGAGDLELSDRPNVLRIIVGKKTPQGTREQVVEISANIDDMNPELCAHLSERLLEEGALDVWWTPHIMKKGRPALALGVMSSAALLECLIQIIFEESSSIGLRIEYKERRTLHREVALVETPYGSVPVKIARQGESVVNVAPEYEACRILAKKLKIPMNHIYDVAKSAWYSQE